MIKVDYNQIFSDTINNKQLTQDYDLGNIFKSIVDSIRFPTLLIGNIQQSYKLTNVDEAYIEEVSKKYLKIKNNKYNDDDIINTITSNTNIINKIIKDDLYIIDQTEKLLNKKLQTPFIEVCVDEYRELKKSARIF